MKTIFILITIFMLTSAFGFEDFLISESANNFVPLTMQRDFREMQLNTIYINQWLNNDWGNYLHVNLEYDEEGNVSFATVYLWNNNNWNHIQRELPSYDNNGNMIEDIIQVWNSGWQNIIRLEMEYNIDNDLIFQLEQDYTNDWMNNTQYTLEYENGFQVSMLTEVWGTDHWINLESDEFIYNADILIERYTYGWLGSEWTESLKYSYVHDEDGNMIEMLKQYYFFGDWLNDEFTMQTFDENADILTLTEQTWISEEWVNSDLTTNTYDEEDIIESLEQVWDNDWQNALLYSFEYSDVDNSNEDVQSSISSFKIQNYPNPFNPSTTIVFDLTTELTENLSVGIYNVKGQLVDEIFPSMCHPEPVEGRGKIHWNASKHSSGIYFAKLIINEKPQATTKMILMK